MDQTEQIKLLKERYEFSRKVQSRIDLSGIDISKKPRGKPSLLESFMTGHFFETFNETGLSWPLAASTLTAWLESKEGGDGTLKVDGRKTHWVDYLAEYMHPVKNDHIKSVLSAVSSRVLKDGYPRIQKFISKENCTPSQFVIDYARAMMVRNLDIPDKARIIDRLGTAQQSVKAIFDLASASSLDEVMSDYQAHGCSFSRLKSFDGGGSEAQEVIKGLNGHLGAFDHCRGSIAMQAMLQNDLQMIQSMAKAGLDEREIHFSFGGKQFNLLECARALPLDHPAASHIRTIGSARENFVIANDLIDEFKREKKILPA